MYAREHECKRESVHHKLIKFANEYMNIEQGSRAKTETKSTNTEPGSRAREEIDSTNTLSEDRERERKTGERIMCQSVDPLLFCSIKILVHVRAGHHPIAGDHCFLRGRRNGVYAAVRSGKGPTSLFSHGVPGLTPRLSSQL